MSRDFLARLRKFVCLGAYKSPVAMLLFAAALQAGHAAAQAPQYPNANQSPNQSTYLAQPAGEANAVAVPLPTTGTIFAQPQTQPVQQVGYNTLSASSVNTRMSELEQLLNQQQQQVASLQQQLQTISNSSQPGSGSIYPGGAAAGPNLPAARSTYVVGSDRGLIGAWTNDGPYFTSKNKDFTFHPRFVSQLDMIGVRHTAPGVGVPGGAGTQDSVNFRRLRIGVDGTMWDTIDYVFELDAAFALQNVDPSQSNNYSTGLRSGGTVAGAAGAQSGNVIGVIQPTTNFLTFKELPLVGNVRVGNQQDWLSLEHIESARFLDFMERSVLMDAFNGPNNNGYDPGISCFRTYFNQNLAIQMGAYQTHYYDSGYAYDIGNSNYTYGGRIHFTPYYDEPTNGRYLIHLGVGAQARQFNNQPQGFTDGTNVRIRAREDLRNTVSTLDPNQVDTGNFYALGQTLINPEFAVVWGPWLFQGEYEAVWMNGASSKKGGTSLNTPFFSGGYVQALYFLTGENRIYNRTSGVFGRTIPNQNAFLVRGACWSKGAWQVGARVDTIDLNSGVVHGGNSTNLTLGLNWWLNPNARFQVNYVHSQFNTLPGTTFAGTAFSLNGSRFVGDSGLNLLGARMDFSF